MDETNPGGGESDGNGPGREPQEPSPPSEDPEDPDETEKAPAYVPVDKPHRCRHCPESFEKGLELANHTRLQHPEFNKPRKNKAAKAQRATTEEPPERPPRESAPQPMPAETGMGPAPPVTTDERAKMLGKVKSMMSRAARLDRDLRDDFMPQSERLRVLSAELNASKSLNREKFTEIQQAVEAEIEPELRELEELAKDVPFGRRKKYQSEYGEDWMDQVLQDQIKKLEREQKIKQLKDFLGGRSGDSDADKIEVVMNGIPVKVRPETAVYWAQEKEKREKEEKIEREDRERRYKAEQENSPYMIMMRERMSFERDDQRRRDEEQRRRDDEYRRREEEFRRQMEQRDREHRELMERMNSQTQQSQQAIAETKLEALKKELDDWKGVATSPASDRVKEVLDEIEAMTGHRPNLKGSGIDPEEVRAKNETEAMKTGLDTISTTMKQGFEMANRRAEAHQRRMEKIETMFMEDRKKELEKTAPRAPPMSPQEAEQRAEEYEKRWNGPQNRSRPPPTPPAEDDEEARLLRLTEKKPEREEEEESGNEGEGEEQG